MSHLLVYCNCTRLVACYLVVSLLVYCICCLSVVTVVRCYCFQEVEEDLGQATRAAATLLAARKHKRIISCNETSV